MPTPCAATATLPPCRRCGAARGRGGAGRRLPARCALRRASPPPPPPPPTQIVDEATAAILKTEVSDGIVAPGYAPGALAILKAKKGGAFIVLEAAAGYEPPPVEFREVYGLVMAQRRNDARIDAGALGAVVTRAGGGGAPLPPGAARDLAVALVTIKYTQSNSVGYALDGAMVGVGAGQQSRVDCVKLAARKVTTWWLRRHPKVLALPFCADVKRVARTNARVRFIEGDMTAVEAAEWAANFDVPVAPLTDAERAEWVGRLSGVALASDAFFPFRDSIDHAAKVGVSFVAQPGGSVQDEDVTKAADAYGMTMLHGAPRLFRASLVWGARARARERISSPPPPSSPTPPQTTERAP